MAINQDIRLKFSSDQSNAIAGIGQLQGKMKSLAAEASGDIQNKISSIFSIAAIEEAVRRTGEWANSLQKASNELGVSTEEMQGLTRMFDKAGVGAEKIETYFDRITVAMDKAKKGSTSLRNDLNKLGVTPDMYNQRPSVAFGAAMANAQGNSGAVADIFGGKNVLQVNAIAKEMGGAGGLSEYTKQHKEEMVSKEDVSAMSQNWESIVFDLKSIGAKLAPLIGLVLGIVDGLLKMVNGIAGTASFGIKSIGSLLGLHTETDRVTGEKLGYGAGNAAMGREALERFRGFAPSLLNAAAQTVSFGHWTPFKDIYNKNNIRDAGIRENEGLSEAVLTAGTFGVGGVAKLAGVGARSANMTAKAMTGNKIFGVEGLAAGADSLSSGVGGNGLLGNYINKMAYSKFKYDNSAKFSQFSRNVGGNLGEDKEAVLDLFYKEHPEVKRISETYKRLDYGFQGAEAANYGGAGASDVTQKDLKAGGGNWGDNSLGANFYQGNTSGPNLAIGGMMGVDNIAQSLAQSIADSSGRTANAVEEIAKHYDTPNMSMRSDIPQLSAGGF
jgi:hypothetical protein